MLRRINRSLGSFSRRPYKMMPIRQPHHVAGCCTRQRIERRDVEDMAQQVRGRRLGKVGLAAGFRHAVEIKPECPEGVLRGRRVTRADLTEGRRSEREQQQERSEKGHLCFYSAATRCERA
jgi:hypothetical protein